LLRHKKSMKIPKG